MCVCIVCVLCAWYVRVMCVYVVPAVAVSSSTDAAALRPTRDEREDLREAGSVGTEEEEQVRVAERCDVKDRGSWNPCACLWVVQRERQRGRAQLSKVYHIYKNIHVQTPTYTYMYIYT